ncbi:UDP-glycosyltransferase 89B1 [Pyrus ussuriensis x Pyrus communis]|uniref:Glycosyltransferase n=1 Tax=Pyrus ussuriensis x Pyrus communis TaxID=2448454 RepID=A0A5N5I3I2_9ROSA|nr:UDP-glycosyltransferase 89B1 [Pyrus ussuriensis x Pyrus communis]
MSSASSTKPHVLVFPYPAQGHMIPLIDLTHQLVSRGLTVTVLVTPKNLPLLDPLLSSSSSQNPNPNPIETLVLPFPPHPSIPAGIENVKDLPIPYFSAMMCALGQLHDPLLRWFTSHPNPPVAIISDMFLGWTHRLATQLGIQRLIFSSSGAFALSIVDALWERMPKRDDPEDQDQIFAFPQVPNSPKYPWWQLSTVYRSYVEGNPDSEFIRDGYKSNRASWGLVINSFTELERVYLEHLKKELGYDRVWAVGPLLPPDRVTDHVDKDDESRPTEIRGGSSAVSLDHIKLWLDACAEDHKVVYVCFGSQAVLTNHQMEAVASGLEKSGVRFVWSVKGPTKGHVEGDYGAVPAGFENRTAGRGLVIRGWAPQVFILSHRAVGAFLTHCGWNSVLESVVAGVPMLAWPRGADQFCNATLLVDQLKVGVRVCEGASTVPDSDELARVLAESVSGDWAERARAAGLREAARQAIKEGGSSVNELDRLVCQLCALEIPASSNLQSMRNGN